MRIQLCSRPILLLAALASILILSLPALAGHHEEDKTPADVIGENVEKSQEIMDKTYREDRAEGEGVVEAAGNAYQAVLEAGREKSDD